MLEKRLYSIRGATSAQNTQKSIQDATESLCKLLFAKNNLNAKDIVNIHFTLTPDLTALNPCTALRKGNVGIETSAIPLFCSQEAVIDGMLPQVIRVMVTAYMDCSAPRVPIYMGEAVKLRPDMVQNGS